MSALPAREGQRIELIFMDGESLPPGTRGTVRFVDSASTIHVKWDNGSTLGLIPDKDFWKEVTEE